MKPTILSIAGLDTWGGGGILTDIKSIESKGFFGLTVLTSIASQDIEQGFRIDSLPTHIIQSQLDTIRSNFDLSAVKIGLLPNIETIEIVESFIKDLNCPIVLDPVLAFKETDMELRQMVEGLSRLIPYSSLITPNLTEGKILLNRTMRISEADLEGATKALYSQFQIPVLLKGGTRLNGSKAQDYFFDGKEGYLLTRQKIATNSINGAGCALSSYIATYLGRSDKLLDAVQHAIEDVVLALQEGYVYQDGQTGNVWRVLTDERND